MTTLPAIVQMGWNAKKLGASCILCHFNGTCIFGKEYNTTCTAKEGINCSVSFEKFAFL